MSKHRVIVLRLISNELSVTEAATEYGISRRHLHRLLARYGDGGLDAIELRSRAPLSSPHRTSERVRDRILEIRTRLTADGLDAGPVTIAWHLNNEDLTPPSTSTIRRILHSKNLITPEPRKRPRASYIRFQAAQPNGTWQSDFTHWRLADGTDVEILNWLDDHARYLLSCTVHTPVTGDDVVTSFLTTIDRYGPPASTLTDNGRVYTARHGGGRNAFEYVLAILNITQKNGAPNHPQTQGKIERFHQTLKRWLTARPRARTTTDLQTQLNTFREHYNTHRPHRALHSRTPETAYTATPKAVPTAHADTAHYRLRYDRVSDGKISLRRAGRMHHLGIGATHNNKRVLAITDNTTVTVTDLTTGEVLSTHTINPDRSYWRNQKREPGRWPNSR